MSDFVTVQYGRIFSDYERELLKMRDSALKDSAKVMKREEELSIRARWFRTGASLDSLQEEFEARGSRSIYRLIVGTFYSIFGEYGTGRRGAATGQPAPRGYSYGDRTGMAARRFSRLAIDAAQPQIRDIHLLASREFAAHMTR